MIAADEFAAVFAEEAALAGHLLAVEQPQAVAFAPPRFKVDGVAAGDPADRGAGSGDGVVQREEKLLPQRGWGLSLSPCGAFHGPDIILKPDRDIGEVLLIAAVPLACLGEAQAERD